VDHIDFPRSVASVWAFAPQKPGGATLQEQVVAGERHHDRPAGCQLDQPVAPGAGHQLTVQPHGVARQRGVRLDGREDGAAVVTGLGHGHHGGVRVLTFDGGQLRGVRLPDVDVGWLLDLHDVGMEQGFELEAEQVDQAGDGQDEQDGHHEKARVEVPAPEGAEPAGAGAAFARGRAIDDLGHGGSGAFDGGRGTNRGHVRVTCVTGGGGQHHVDAGLPEKR
jgi:hypothetical protein